MNRSPAAGRSDKYRQAILPEIKTQLGQGGLLRLEVTSDSMRPLLRRGDAVLVAPLSASELQVGDIVVWQRQETLLVHRAIRLAHDKMYSKGDAARAADPPQPHAALLGRVEQIERAGRFICIRDRAWRWAGRLVARISAWEGVWVQALAGPGVWRGRFMRLVCAPLRAAVWAVMMCTLWIQR